MSRVHLLITNPSPLLFYPPHSRGEGVRSPHARRHLPAFPALGSSPRLPCEEKPSPSSWAAPSCLGREAEGAPSGSRCAQQPQPCHSPCLALRVLALSMPCPACRRLALPAFACPCCARPCLACPCQQDSAEPTASIASNHPAAPKGNVHHHLFPPSLPLSLPKAGMGSVKVELWLCPCSCPSRLSEQAWHLPCHAQAMPCSPLLPPCSRTTEGVGGTAQTHTSLVLGSSFMAMLFLRS